VEGVRLFVTGAERAQDYVAALLPGEAQLSGALTLRTADGAVTVTRAFFPGAGEGSEDGAEATDAASVLRLLKRGGRP
jgi:hypothetical protein